MAILALIKIYAGVKNPNRDCEGQVRRLIPIVVVYGIG